MATAKVEPGQYTAAITAYAARFGYDALPADVVEWAKTIVLDTFGALLLGSNPQYGASWLTGELAKEMGGTPECTVIGRDFKTFSRHSQRRRNAAPRFTGL